LRSSRPIGILKRVAFEFAPGVRRGLNGYSVSFLEAENGNGSMRLSTCGLPDVSTATISDEIALGPENSVRFTMKSLNIIGTSGRRKIIDDQQGIFGRKRDALERISGAGPACRQMSRVQFWAEVLLDKRSNCRQRACRHDGFLSQGPKKRGDTLMKIQFRLMACLCAVVALGITGAAEGTTFLIHDGNNDPLNEFGDTGLAWSGNPLVPRNAADLDSEGNPIGEDSLADELGASRGWVRRVGAFAAAGLDGSSPWFYNVRANYLRTGARGGNTDINDAQTNWAFYWYNNRVVHFSTNDVETIISDTYPGPGFHDYLVQYLPAGGGLADRAEYYIDGDLKLTLTRTQAGSTIGDLLQFGGHSQIACCNTEIYFSHAELSDGIFFSGPPSTDFTWTQISQMS